MLTVDHVSIRFGPTVALDDVTLRFHPGTVHALLGENGAGKSTLARVIAGEASPTAGRVEFRGTPLSGAGASRVRARACLVHQELAQWPHLTVAENIVLRGAMGLFRRFDATDCASTARRVLTRLGSTVDPASLVGDLSPSDQRLVQIAAGLLALEQAGDRGVIVFDEPTAGLGPTQARAVLGLVRCLRDEGHTVIFVSHSLEEVAAAADRIVVLRDGQVVMDRAAPEATRHGILEAMIGREIPASVPRPAVQAAPVPRLAVTDLTSPGRITGVTLNVDAGEIVGLAGLAGSGRSSLVLAVAGVIPTRGTMRVDGRPIGPCGPTSMRRAGIVLLSEERAATGLLPTVSITENVLLPNARLATDPAARELAARQLERCRVKAPRPQSLPSELSGGNQQKVLLARCLLCDPPILLLDEPTRGVDIGAKAEIHGLIREAAVSGSAVLVASSDLPELIQLCDRVLVMRRGRICGEVCSPDLTEMAILRLATGTAD